MTDDDEVQEVPSPARADLCQLCKANLARKSVSAKQEHYNQHLNQTKETKTMQDNIIDLSSDESQSEKQESNSKAADEETKSEALSSSSPSKQNIFWHNSMDSPPPKNFTPGLISVLKQALVTSHEKGQTARAALCYPGMVHVSTELWDLGWGCGYRNFLMACTALIDQQVQPLYFPALDEPTPPGVRNLQQWIEDAWKAGYDKEGAADLQHKLVNTRKWIGTAELHVAFLSRGIPSRLVDFPSVTSRAEAVVRWIENYFSSPLPRGAHSMRAKVKTTVDEALRGASPVVVTDRMPIVLQHDGHSRTIVGYERTKDGSVNLLCFDPARRVNSSIREAALATLPKTSKSSSSTRHRSISPSKLFRKVLHPFHNKRSSSSPNTSSSSSSPIKRRREHEDEAQSMKRVRGGLTGKNGARKDDVIIIDDDNDNDDEESYSSQSAGQSTLDSPTVYRLDHSKVLSSFRLKPQKVGQNDQYQILYFTLEGILTEEERWARRVVTSEVVR